MLNIKKKAPAKKKKAPKKKKGATLYFAPLAIFVVVALGIYTGVDIEDKYNIKHGSGSKDHTSDHFPNQCEAQSFNLSKYPRMRRRYPEHSFFVVGEDIPIAGFQAIVQKEDLAFAMLDLPESNITDSKQTWKFI